MTRNYDALEPENRNWMFIDSNCRNPNVYLSYRQMIVHILHTFLWSGGLEVHQVQQFISLSKITGIKD